MSRYTEKKTITRQEYYQLAGLLAIGHKKVDELNDIELAMNAITGEQPRGGHSVDALFQPYSVYQLLENLELKIEKEEPVDGTLKPEDASSKLPLTDRWPHTQGRDGR